MALMRSVIRMLAPFGLVDMRRKMIHFHRMGQQVPWWRLWRHEEDVQACRFDLWPRRLREGPADWTLIDVGANVGNFTAACHRLASPARTLVIEPQAQCRAVLRERLRDLPNCTLVPVAVGAHEGTVGLQRTRSSAFASTLRPRGGLDREYGDSAVVEGEEQVALQTLDGICAAHGVDSVGLLKIDVQGAELDALRGARRTLERTAAVLVEVNFVKHYEGACSFADMNRLFEQSGFVLFGTSAPCVGRSSALWTDAIYANPALVDVDHLG